MSKPWLKYIPDFACHIWVVCSEELLILHMRNHILWQTTANHLGLMSICLHCPVVSTSQCPTPHVSVIATRNGRHYRIDCQCWYYSRSTPWKLIKLVEPGVRGILQSNTELFESFQLLLNHEGPCACKKVHFRVRDLTVKLEFYSQGMSFLYLIQIFKR